MVTVSDIKFCAELLRDVWGMGGNITAGQAHRLAALASDEDERALHVCLRITGI